MLGHQVVHVVGHRLLQLLAGVLLQELAQHGEGHLLGDAALLRVKVHEVLHIHHVVGEHFHQLAVHIQDSLIDPSVLQLPGPLPGQVLPGLGDDLTGTGIGYGQGQLLAGQPGPQSHLLVELIAAHRGQVVAAGIKEQAVEQALSGVHRGRLAGTQLTVDLQQGLLIVLAGILLQGRLDALVLTEHLDDLGVGLGSDGPDQAGDRQFAVLVDAHIEHVGQVGLILQPGSPIGNDGGGESQVVRLVRSAGIVHAGGTDDLGDDDPLSAVDDEGAGIGHDGEISHEDLLLLDLLGLLVAQAHPDLDGRGVGAVPGLALLHVILGLLVHGVVDEGQLQVAGVVSDGGYVPKDLPQSHVQEPLVGLLLDLQQIGHLQDLLIAGKALSQGLSVIYVLDRHF